MGWKQMKTENYLLFFHPDSAAEKDILAVSQWQEACYRRISAELGFRLEKPIRMYLCDSAGEIAEITGCPPCHAMTFDYDLIYAVYSENIRCLGPHEDAHLFSYQIAIPESLFLKEGFAMYFDGSYHGRKNEEIARNRMRSEPGLSVAGLLDNRQFLQLPEEIAYPLAGAFAVWFIRNDGMDKYLDFYRNNGRTKKNGESSFAAQGEAFADDLRRD